MEKIINIHKEFDFAILPQSLSYGFKMIGVFYE